MNYLSHGRDHLGRPYALAGTALPDWLRVLHRHFRFDPDALEAPGADDRSPDAELLRGVIRHYADDAWFHASPTFERVSRAVTDRIRAAYPEPLGNPRPRHIRASFYGHVLPEMLLDAFIAERQPDALERYYASLDAVDVDVVVAFAEVRLARTPERLGELIEGFRRYAFLRTYTDDHEVSLRLGQVSRRVGLPPLPGGFDAVVAFTRDLVRENGAALLRAPG